MTQLVGQEQVRYRNYLEMDMSKARNFLSKFKESISDEVDILADMYDLDIYRPKGRSNARQTWTGEENGANIKVEDFGSFINVTVAFGEVRNVSRNTLGEHGVAHATGKLKGQDTVEWRIYGVAPKGRTVNVKNKNITKSIGEDIIAELLKMKSAVSKGDTAKGDLTSGMWDKADKGWG